MSPYEEELQKSIENGQAPREDGLDVKAYQEVFRALKKDPDYALSSDFAQRVVARVVSRERASAKDYLWFGAGIFFLLAALIATVLFIGFRFDFGFDFGFLNVMADYKGLVVFGIVFIALLNWVDKRLVKEKQRTAMR